jgi:hypothetical protein
MDELECMTKQPALVLVAWSIKVEEGPDGPSITLAPLGYSHAGTFRKLQFLSAQGGKS